MLIFFSCVRVLNRSVIDQLLGRDAYQLVPGLDIVTVVSPTGASTHTSYIPFLRQRGEASTGGCLGTSMASNGLNIAEFRGLVY